MQYAGWRKKNYKNGSFRLVDGQKFILVHKSLGEYWIDYGINGRHMMATLPPVKTLREANRMIEVAKREFRTEPKL